MTDTQARCYYCGAILIALEDVMKFTLHPWRFPHRFTYDHIVSRFFGGSDAPENRVPCCHSCNMAKGIASVEEFRLNVSERYGLGRVVFYGEGGALADSLRISAASIQRWNEGIINACVWLTPPPKRRVAELRDGAYIEADPVAVFPAQEYFIGAGAESYTIVDSTGTIVSQTMTNTRQDRSRVSRLVLQANAALTLTPSTPTTTTKGHYENSQTASGKRKKNQGR
jgi:hypothetical protein